MMLELTDSFDEYKKESTIVDFSNARILSLAEEIRFKSSGMNEILKRTFEYVRDQIAHSSRSDNPIVTCTASEVMREKVGTCYAKSHLLAALLRANGIPCGFCYQRLILDDINAPVLVLHGLNAVYIEQNESWVRIDASNTRSGRHVEFDINREGLAYTAREELGEKDIPAIFSRPDRNITAKLTQNNDIMDLLSDLPKELAGRETLRKIKKGL